MTPKRSGSSRSSARNPGADSAAIVSAACTLNSVAPARAFTITVSSGPAVPGRRFIRPGKLSPVT
jgi:hypothetical protein